MLNTHGFLKSLATLYLCIFCLSVSGFDLPINAELDRLILAAENAHRHNNQHEAKNFLSQAKALNTPLPNQFYFLYGATLFHLNELNAASLSLVKFVAAAERGSPDYVKALSFLTSIEQRNIEQRARSRKPTSEPIEQPASLLENTEAQYILQLKQLYLTSSDSGALLKHINEMLTTYALKRQEKIIKLGQRPLARYQLSNDRSGNLVTSSQKINLAKNTSSKSVIDTTKINIYGIDPFITYRCSTRTNSCWLRSPVNGEAWIEISNNEQAITEIAKAFTALIKILQKGEA